MSIVSIRPCYNLKSALDYQEFKNGIERVAFKGSNIEPYDFRGLAEKLTMKYGRLRQGYTVIQSFSKSELDCKNPEHIELAEQLAYELMARMFPNSPFQVVVHTDSVSGCLHTHSTVINHNFATGKALQNTSWYQLRKTNDELMAENSMEVCERKERSLDQQEYWNSKRDEEKYSWQEDLRTRINKAMEVAKTLRELSVYLGVEGVQRNFYKADGKSLLKHFSFSFKDENGKEHKKRGDKLGILYIPEAIQVRLRENQQKAIIPMSDWVELQKGKENMEKKSLNITQEQTSDLKTTLAPLKAMEEAQKSIPNINTVPEPPKRKKIDKGEVAKRKRQQRIIEIQRDIEYYEERKFELDKDSPEYKIIQKKLSELNTELSHLYNENLKQTAENSYKLNESLLSETIREKDKGYSFC